MLLCRCCCNCHLLLFPPSEVPKTFFQVFLRLLLPSFAFFFVPCAARPMFPASIQLKTNTRDAAKFFLILMTASCAVTYQYCAYCSAHPRFVRSADFILLLHRGSSPYFGLQRGAADPRAPLGAYRASPGASRESPSVWTSPAGHRTISDTRRGLNPGSDYPERKSLSGNGSDNI